MNISKVAANSNLGTSNKQDSVVTSLEKQKTNLLKQIEAIKGSDQDSKTKTEKIAELNTQIADIDQQIMQAKVDAKKREIEAAQQKNTEKAENKRLEQETDEENQGVILSPSLNKLLSANKCSSDYEKLHNTRRKLIGEIKVAQCQMEHALHGAVKSQMDLISNIGPKVANVENAMVKKMDEVQKDLKQSVTIGKREAEKARENKDEIKTEDNTEITTENDASQVTTEHETETVVTNTTNPDDTDDKTDKKNNHKPKSIDMTI